MIAVKDSKKEFCPHTQLMHSDVHSEIFTNDVVDALNGLEVQRRAVARVLSAGQKAIQEAMLAHPEAKAALDKVNDAMVNERMRVVSEIHNKA